MTGSVIPAALTALVAVWRAAAPTEPAGFEVFDGPTYDDPPNRFLAVGWDRSDNPSVATRDDMGDYGDVAGLETVAVSSLLSFAAGDADLATVRGALFTAFGSFCAALSADRTLGGVVMHARVSDYDVTPILTEVGAVMDLLFTTHIRAST